MIYENGKRFYIIEGRKFPSVNTVLSVLPEASELRAWKARTENWQEIFEYRRLQGNIIHYRIASDIAMQNGFPPPPLPLRMEEKQSLQVLFQNAPKRNTFNKEVEMAIAMFNDWELEYKPKWLDVEMVVHSKEYLFAGTVDGYCIINDTYWAIDLKSTPFLFTKFEYQLSGYRLAMREMGKKCDSIGLLNISPTLRTKYGYKFTRLGDFSKDFIRARYRFTHQYTI